MPEHGSKIAAEKPAQHDALHVEGGSRAEAFVGNEDVGACQNYYRNYNRNLSFDACSQAAIHQPRASAMEEQHVH